MNITIISTSMQANSQSAKVANFIQSTLSNEEVTTKNYDLYDLNLPFYDPASPSPIWQSISAVIQNSDGFVFVSPEWNGSVSPMYDNFLMYGGVKEFAHKPALIVSVSSGSGGAFPISQMRQIGYKNTRLLYIPEHLIVRGVKDVLNQVESENENDNKIRTRIEYALEILKSYCTHLKTLRENTNFRFDKFKNGMN